MNDILSLSVYAWILGIGATIILDLWILIGQLLLNIPAPNWSMVGRWVGHMRQGQFIQQNLNTAPAIKMETALGWLVHYLTGIIYGYLLLLIWGHNWFQQPTILAPLTLLWVSLIAPFFIMMPGMGQGIAASKSSKPNFERLKSVVGHSVFGLGMYLTALALN